MNELHFGDNLDVLRAMSSHSVDLIYLDPPFNSNASYNILYGTKRGGPSQAQAHTFGDTWDVGNIRSAGYRGYCATALEGRRISGRLQDGVSRKQHARLSRHDGGSADRNAR